MAYFSNNYLSLMCKVIWFSWKFDWLNFVKMDLIVQQWKQVNAKYKYVQKNVLNNQTVTLIFSCNVILLQCSSALTACKIYLSLCLRRMWSFLNRLSSSDSTRYVQCQEHFIHKSLQKTYIICEVTRRLINGLKNN